MYGNRVDADELALVSQSLSDIFGQADPDEFHCIEAMLGSLGWDDVIDQYPDEAERALATCSAISLKNCNALDRALVDQLRITAPGLREITSALVLLPWPSTANPAAPPGVAVGMMQARPQDDQLVVVPYVDDARAFVATVRGSDITCTPLASFDRSVTWFHSKVALPEGTAIGTQWESALAKGHRLVATQVLALADRSLSVAAEHVSSRKQYGCSLATFQTVRHRLAQAHAELGGARALLDLAWSLGSFRHAQSARLAVERAGRTVRASALQLCGAIGLTEEHELHRYVARAMQIDLLLGPTSQLEMQLSKTLFGAENVCRPLPQLATVL